jgi:hypothetical protein
MEKTMYQQLPDQFGQPAQFIKRLSDNAFIPFDPANTDFANFKKEILADEAQLQDADGNVMTDSKDYVRTLP